MISSRRIDYYRLGAYTVRMAAALLIVMLGIVAPVSSQNTGSCNYKASCPWRCCRGTPGNPACWCSRCCVTRSTDLGADDRAQTIEAGKNRIAVFRHRVEFYREGESAPRAVRRFKEGLYPPEPPRPGEDALLLCTSEEWAVVASTEAETGFCGAFTPEGREVFRLKEREASGLSREPVGVRGREALFALTRARGDGARELVGYRLWRKGKPSELLPSDGPKTRETLERFEGRLVLPAPHDGN